ncbi:MAG: hypothetical protein M1829_000809 [Trizodia sp. TS-e1964]|nr:MAG: hypothetical protein M1829_000809 [Trizodia sp. TS-e1964]
MSETDNLYLRLCGRGHTPSKRIAPVPHRTALQHLHHLSTSMPALTTTYLLPALMLNPVLLLHTLNTLFSRILPPPAALLLLQPQPPHLPAWGPWGTPHIDVHSSQGVCWSYTVVMVGLQLLAFGRVGILRESRREVKRLERLERERTGVLMASGGASGGVNGANGVLVNGKGMNGVIRKGKASTSLGEDWMFSETEEEDNEEDEIMG